MKDLIDEAKRLLAAATPGPWFREHYGMDDVPDGYTIDSEHKHICDTKILANAEFIAFARNSMQQLIEIIERQERAIEHARGEFAAATVTRSHPY